MAVQQPISSATWGIAPSVRRAIARSVLELRAALEDDFRRQLAALGIRDSSIEPVAAGRTPSPDEQRARDIAIAVIKREIEGGLSHAEALDSYIREAAFTFLNRLVGLRCMEERGLLLVDGQPETAIKIDRTRNASSLYWRVRNELPSSTSPREVWRETLRRACVAISQQVRVLFDPDAENAALLPLQPTLQKVVDALNAADIAPQTYAEDELLGWVYQYYGQQEKDEVYAKLGKGKKIDRPEELAAATCLYTERYMVDYLLQNTLGALWVEMHLESKLPEKWPYYVHPPEGNPVPERELKRVRDITVMDPACGSGHFLLRAFDLVADMYAEEGIERPEEMPHLILERNLHGIDIDLRAVQIAALALYLKACSLAGPGFRPRRLNLVAADAVLPGDEPPAEYMARFTGDKEMEALVRGIWRGLRNVREFGSLLHPEGAVDEVVRRRREREKGQFWEDGDVEWERWKVDLLGGLRDEFERQAQSEDLGQRLFGAEAAKGVSLVEALGRRYDVVVTNPPYMGGRSLGPDLKGFVEHAYKDGKHDLYACFILRCRDFGVPAGFVGMVTQQSWLFLRSFSPLRQELLTRARVTTLAQMGEHAFEESAAAGAFVALFTLQPMRPQEDQRMVAIRLIGPKCPADKESLLRQAIGGQASTIVSAPRQADFLQVPEMPFVYWIRPKFFELLRSPHRVEDIAAVRQGLATSDNERFLRWAWEVNSVGVVRDCMPASGRWFRFAKGGRYQKWAGLGWLFINWEDDGKSVKQMAADLYGSVTRTIKNQPFYFRPGLTYTLTARGSMNARELADSVFDVQGTSIFLHDPPSVSLAEVAALLCTRLASYLLRTTSQSLVFHAGYVAKLPLPKSPLAVMGPIGRTCIALKRSLVSQDPLERTFGVVPEETVAGERLVARSLQAEETTLAVQALLHAMEALNEKVACDAYGLDDVDVAAIVDETGTPAGWYPLVAGHDALPEAWDASELLGELRSHLQSLYRRGRATEELVGMKSRLRALYQAGPGAAIEDDAENGGDEPASEAALGARIPIPAETFLEELSQKLKVHPISVYWLLKEMREQEGLLCPPELKRHLEDYISITILRLLGYRWPEQDAYEEQQGPIIDADLVDEDGIIPLVPCADQPTAEQRVRMRLERDFGEDGAAQSEREFRQWVGRDIGEWLRRDFFKRHVQQFKQRPIAWHLVSPERTFEAFVLYHKLSRATLQKLRAQYAGELIARLQGEQERARQRDASAEVSRLQLAIEDVEEFRARIEAIERGDELKYRIRCRWKGEDEAGRPGPYAPDIDDGVKVNIRPFQEAGLLAMKQVIKKW